MKERTAPVELDELLSHANWVRALARRLARDHESADDLVQETWLTALRRPPSAGPGLRGWLARVLFNSARRRDRTERRLKRRESRAADIDPAEEQMVLEADEQHTISAHVLKLDEPYRSVVLRHYWRGESPAQIARKTGRSAATVRSQLSRGRAELRRSLQAHYGESGRDMHSALFLASGPSWLTPITDVIWKAAIMKQSEKFLWIAAAGLVLVALDQGRRALSPVPEPPSTVDSVRAPMSEARVAPEVEASEPLVALADERRGVPTEATVQAQESVGHTLKLVGRFVDRDGLPLADALLRAQRGDAMATSDAEGRVELVLPEVEPSKRNPYLRPTPFLAECAGYATRYLAATPVTGGVTRLGDIVMEPGGSLGGWIVDGEGLPLDGIRVYATEVELYGPPELTRSRGPRDIDKLPFDESEAGQFAVGGIPTGFARLWARGEGTGWVVSDPIEVMPGSQDGDVRFVLAALERDHLILGLVEGPDGNPVADAQLFYQFPSENIGAGYGTTNEAGRFEIVTETSEAYALRVEDRQQRWRPCILRDIVPGGEELVVVFEETAWMTVSVIDAKTSEAIDEPWVYTRGEDTLEYDSRAAKRSVDLGIGERLVRIPQERFQLHVQKDHYEDFSLGPFEPHEAPENIVARLEALAAVRGIVTHEGEVVPGARVRLLPTPREDEAISSHGFPMRMDPFGNASGESDEEGRFAVTVEEAGLYVLIVSKDGLAVGERGPLNVDPERDLSGMDVELTGGGELEGRVLTPDHRDPSGIIISISRGDGDVRFTRTDDQGLYHFEHLAPGGWNVAQRDQETSTSVTFAAISGEREPIEWDCEVVDGQVTFHDIDLRDVTPGLLRGQLLIDGVGAVGWNASLADLTGGNLTDSVRSTVLSTEGNFELSAAQGAWRLWLQSPTSDSATTMIFENVVLVSEPVEWRQELETTTLVGRAPEASTQLRFWKRDEVGTGRRTSFTTDEFGEFEVTLPAGHGFLLRAEPAEGHIGGMGWTTLREMTLPPGEVVRVEFE